MTHDSPETSTESTALTNEPTENDPTEGSAQPVSRRTLLKGAASAAIGVTGLTEVSGTAAAGGCSYPVQRAPSWFGHINIETGATHNVPWGTDQITIFIHGFRTQRQGARDYGWEVWRKLHDMGYPGDGISCIWDAGNSLSDWGTAKGNANTAGIALADWLARIGSVQNNGIEVNLVCHSLGARVGLECLRRLHLTHNLYINTVHFLGGAVWDKLVSGYYHYNVYWGCNWLHNWHSRNDTVLGSGFTFREGGKWPVGWKGIESGTPPGNYTDHPHGFEINEHCQYMDYNAGVVNDLYYKL
jgi:hypothetical protein